MFLTKPPNKATPRHLKKHNEGLLLSAIYAHESISRVQLARLTHLSRPAVTELTQGLLENNLIEAIGPDRTSAKVGKRPTLLAFNPDAYHMVTVDLSGDGMSGALLNLRGRVASQQKASTDGATPEESLDTLCDLIAALVGQSTRPLLGIAVGTPGIVDTRTGIVRFAANLDWTDVPLVPLLSERFHLPVHIGNDTRLAALGEHHFGLGQGIDNLFVITLGTGVGSGIIIDGQLVWGSVYGAGEIGHIPIGGSDDVCVCGRRGCLETVVSGWAIARRVQQIAREHPESLLSQAADGITALTVQRAAEQGDAQALALIEQVSTALGLALTTVIHLLNPQRIILGGSLARMGDRFVDQVRRTVQERALPQLADQTDIVLSNLGDRTVLLGAGALLLERELGLWRSQT